MQIEVTVSGLRIITDISKKEHGIRKELKMGVLEEAGEWVAVNGYEVMVNRYDQNRLHKCVNFQKNLKNFKG